MITIKDTPANQANNKDNKKKYANAEKRRRAVYGDQHVYVLRSQCLNKKYQLMIRFGLEQSAIKYAILDYMITRMHSKKNAMGGDMIDLTEANFTKNRTFSEEIFGDGISYGAFKNVKSSMAKSKLIVLSGRGEFALHPHVIEFLTGTTVAPIGQNDNLKKKSVPATGTLEKKRSYPLLPKTVTPPITDSPKTVITPMTHNKYSLNKKLVITDAHNDRLSQSEKVVTWSLVGTRDSTIGRANMADSTKLRSFLEELKELNKESKRAKVGTKEKTEKCKSLGVEGYPPPSPPEYPPREFKLGRLAKYNTGINGLKQLVYDLVKGKLWVDMKSRELDELGDRVYELERKHGDLFFEYLQLSANFTQESGRKLTLRDVLFDDKQIQEVTEKLWKKRLKER